MMTSLHHLVVEEEEEELSVAGPTIEMVGAVILVNSLLPQYVLD